MQTEKEVGRHQGMDRPGVHQVSVGSEIENGRNWKEVICGAPASLTIKG